MKIEIHNLTEGVKFQIEQAAVCGWPEHRHCCVAHEAEYPIPGDYRIVSVSAYPALDLITVHIRKEPR